MSDLYLLPCSCGEKIRVGRAQAGQMVDCTCGKQVQVPTLRGLRDLDIAPPEANPMGARTPWGPVRGALFSGGILLAVLAVVFVVYHLVWYSRYNHPELTTDRTETVIAMEEEQIDQMTAADMYDLWHEVETQGIGPKMLPIWQLSKREAASHSRQAIIAGVIGVVGVLAALGAVLVGRKAK